MDVLETLAMLLPLSVAAGVNLYATVLVTGVAIRFEWVTSLPEGLDVLASWPVIVTAGVLFLLESLADKIQFVDNVWDVLHTVIRPLGATLLAVAALGEADPIVQVLAGLLAGSAAFATHATKASARVAVNVASPVENVSNVAISSVEDVGVLALAWLALAHPWIALAVGVALLVVIAIVGPIVVRWAWFCGKAILCRLKAVVSEVRESDVPPGSQMEVLEHRKPDLAARCKAGRVPGARGRTGHLCVLGDELAFTWDGLTDSHAWFLPLHDVVAAYLRPGILVDVLEVHYRAGERRRAARFIFGKDRAPLAARLAGRLEQRQAA